MANNIKFENLIAGALVIFGRIDRLTMALLIDELNKYYQVNIDEEEIHNNYITRQHGIYEIKGSTEEERAIARCNLARTQGQAIIEFFEHLDSQDFVLEKIDHLNGIHALDVKQHFSNVEIILVDELQKSHHLTTVIKKGYVIGKYPEIVLTTKGRKRLFIRNYQNELTDFISLLEREKMNTAIIPEFLDAQNYENDVYDILNLDNFRIFCMIHNKSMFEEPSTTTPSVIESSAHGIPYLKVIRPSSKNHKPNQE